MSLLGPIYKRYKFLLNKADKKDVDALYMLLYNQVHNLDQALPLATAQTIGTFGFQWGELQEGEAMLSDPWFKENVTKLISENETLLKKDWFKGKDIMDCGCGGGRWSYGLAKLGANITAVDINESAIEATKSVLSEFSVKKQFIQTPLEQLSSFFPDGKQFDMVWSWGVIHHCGSFTKALAEVAARVKEGGFIYMYLYGRESLSFDEDIQLFRNRVYYNTLPSWKEKEAFLLEKAHGDKTKVHQYHDIFAPLLNRRLDFSYMKKALEDLGFTDVTRTTKSPELFIRAVKTKMKKEDEEMIIHNDNNLPWINRYSM